MTLKAKVASALSFAHLAGLGRKAKATEDDDDKKDRDHEDGDAKKAKADGDEPDDDKEKKDGPDAEGDDPDSHAEDDEPEKKDDDDKKSKSKAEDGDDDEKMKAGAKQERTRCAAIFASPAAARNVALAAELAFQTELSAEQAIGILAKAPAGSVHADRAGKNPRVGAGGSSEVTGKQAIDSRWDRAFSKVSPAKRH